MSLVYFCKWNVKTRVRNVKVGMNWRVVSDLAILLDRGRRLAFVDSCWLGFHRRCDSVILSSAWRSSKNFYSIKHLFLSKRKDRTLHSPTIPGGFLIHSWFVPKVLVDS